MRRSYASGYSRQKRSEPSLAWFVLGAIAIGVGYVYVSGLGESDEEAPGVNGPTPVEGGAVTPEGPASPSPADNGTTGGEIVMPAIPVIESGKGLVPESGGTWRSETGMVLAWIPGGSYMVRTDEGVSNKSFEGGFWMAVRPVSEADYEKVTGTNPVPEGKRDPSAPVTRVSWGEATAFAKQLTLKEHRERRLPLNYEYRIPSETIWEYAAGGGEDGAALRIRESDSRDLTWWRLNGVREFRDSHHEGALRAGALDVGVVNEWTSDSSADSGPGIKVVRGAPHTAFLGREEEVVKSRYKIFHQDEKLPFLGFRLAMVKTGPDRNLADGGGITGNPSVPVVVRPLDPGESVDYVKRSDSFNLQELFEGSRHSRDSSLTKYNILRKVQLELKKHGYYNARVDGYPGRSTQKAIDQFQAVSGLPKTGRLDDLTLNSLGLVDEDTSSDARPRTAAVSEPPGRPSPMPAVPQPPKVTRVPAVEESRPEPPKVVKTARAAESPPFATPPPRAVPAYPGNISQLPRAVPVRPNGQATPPNPGFAVPPRELKYEGFRGKLRQLGDTLSGTYDPREDPRRR